VITGLGFTEMLAILLLVLVFFGSKELPHFIREAGRMMNKLRRYSDQVRREFDDISRSVDPNVPARSGTDTTAQRKAALRKRLGNARKALSDEQREQLSARVVDEALNLDEVRGARAVMVYLHLEDEVKTDSLVVHLLNQGKRVVVPYCRPSSRDLGIAEIHDIEKDTVEGSYGIREPLKELQDSFLKSDVHAVIIPGVGFDKLGGRLGRGKGYYDNFLRELSGRVPFIGLAFGCQISEEAFPFDYHDVPMDQVVTEDGPLMRRGAAATEG
jgi:5-formyltetrahydrofolate cyclo-ligase